MKRVIFFLTALALVSWGYHFFSTTFSQDEALNYTTDWEQGLQSARETGAPILLNFGGPW